MSKPVPGPGTVCKCGHWFEEHDSRGVCLTCADLATNLDHPGWESSCWETCGRYEFDPEQNTVENIADRGGDPDSWPEWMKDEVRRNSAELDNDQDRKRPVKHVISEVGFGGSCRTRRAILDFNLDGLPQQFVLQIEDDQLVLYRTTEGDDKPLYALMFDRSSRT